MRGRRVKRSCRGGGRESIISRAPYGHAPRDAGSNVPLRLAAYMPPLRIVLKKVKGTDIELLLRESGLIE